MALPSLPLIRLATREDAAAVASLATVLGYPSDSAAIAKRLDAFAGDARTQIWIATVSDVGVGWIQATEFVALESGAQVEIIGLVVAPSARRAGVGRQLVDAVVAWARARSCPRVTVRTRVERVESHVFYAALGFEVCKVQQVYRRHLE